jgi:hypothetical protein
MDPGPFFYIVITVYHLLALFTFSQTTIFYHSICLILSLQQTGEIDNLTVSWGKVLICVVCRFHITVGAKLRPRRGAIYKLSGAVMKLASINLRKLILSPTGSINLGFILREDLLLCSSYLPRGVPNWAIIYTPSCSCSHLILRKLPWPISATISRWAGVKLLHSLIMGAGDALFWSKILTWSNQKIKIKPKKLFQKNKKGN